MDIIRNLQFTLAILVLTFSSISSSADEVKKDPIACHIDLSNERIECLFPKGVNKGFLNGNFYLCAKYSDEDFICLVVPREIVSNLDIDSIVHWADLKYHVEKYGVPPLQKLPHGVVRGYDSDGLHEAYYEYYPETEEFGAISSIKELSPEAELVTYMEGKRYVILCTESRPILLMSTASYNDVLEKVLQSLKVLSK